MNGETRQHRKNITILQTFASANTKSGKLLTIVPDSKEDLNQQGLRGSANATTIAYVGGLDWGETIKSADRDSIINNLATGRERHKVPSDAKRINSVANVDEEFIITEDGSYLIEEIDHGFLMQNQNQKNIIHIYIRWKTICWRQMDSRPNRRINIRKMVVDLH